MLPVFNEDRTPKLDKNGKQLRKVGELFMIPVPNRNETTLTDVIKSYINPKSIIHSDKWGAYANLKVSML